MVDDEDMLKTVESVKEFGVFTPAIVRPDPDGGYEIISGHRRHRASELAGKDTMPVIVRDIDRDCHHHHGGQQPSAENILPPNAPKPTR